MMTFNDLVNYKIKINHALDIFDKISNMIKDNDDKNSFLLFTLKLGIFFYFLCLIFVFHLIYCYFKKVKMMNIYQKELHTFVQQHGYDTNYWKQQIDNEIQKQKIVFFKQNKMKQDAIALQEEDDN